MAVVNISDKVRIHQAEIQKPPAWYTYAYSVILQAALQPHVLWVLTCESELRKDQPVDVGRQLSS